MALESALTYTAELACVINLSIIVTQQKQCKETKGFLGDISPPWWEGTAARCCLWWVQHKLFTVVVAVSKCMHPEARVSITFRHQDLSFRPNLLKLHSTKNWGSSLKAGVCVDMSDSNREGYLSSSWGMGIFYICFSLHLHLSLTWAVCFLE